MRRPQGPGLSYLLLLFIFYCLASHIHVQSDVTSGFLSTNKSWSISEPETMVGFVTLDNENNASAFLVTNFVHESFLPHLNSWSFLTFVKSSENQFYLSLVVSGSVAQCKGEVVWTANYNQPVSQKAGLELQPDGNLVLSDPLRGSSRRAVWSTHTAGIGVEGILVLGRGVVELRGVNNNTAVWQSSNHPTDTLLPCQFLHVGDTLHSRSSPFNLSWGTYSLVVKPGGVGLYVDASNDLPELYWMWKVYDNNDSTLDDPDPDSDSGQQCSDTSFTISIGLPQLCLKFSSTCNGSLLKTHYYHLQSFKTHPNLSLSDFVLLRLDYNGNLIAYAAGGEKPLYQAMSKCQLPSSCGDYGVCTEQETCEPANNGTHHLSNGLSLNYPTCENANGNTWQMFSVAGVGYYRNRYVVPMNMLTKEDCSHYCLQNCSCRTSFYLAESNSCFAVSSQVGTLSKTSNPNHFAFIKLQSTDLVENSNISDNRSAVIVRVSVTVFLVTAVCLVCIYPCRSCRNSKPELVRSGENHLEQVCSGQNHLEHGGMSTIADFTARKFSFKEIQTITRNFHKVLGSGGFGTVYNGLLRDGTKVAVKKLEIATQGEKEFYSEVVILGIIHHCNLVQLIGFCAEKSHKILVYKYMANGSLDQWLFNDKTIKFLTWPIRFHIIMGSAKGLAYLHEECRYKIIHLDVKPQNILLDENFNAKVSDFGLATLMGRNDSRVVTSMRGTPGYLAPEWWLQCAITDKSDVYSFGMVLLEIVGGRKNNNMRLADSDKHYFPTWAMSMATSGREMEVIDSRIRNEIHRAQALKVLKIGFLCIQEDAHRRPSMATIVQMLEGEEDVPQHFLTQLSVCQCKSNGLS